MILTDNEYNSLSFNTITGAELKQLVGFQIIEAEPINYPDTDGVELILKGKQGQLIALCINTNIDNYISLNEAIRAVRSPVQTRQLLELEEEPELDQLPPISIEVAHIKKE